jgi:UDP-GlcNAc:undecaprenyl-phosphate GlcNAc-1-phosphate transferase
LSDEARLALAAAVSLAAALVLVPAAIRLAAKTGFYDRPAGHKVHSAPTPYLGGSALMLAFFAGSVTIGGNFWRLWPILVGALVLAVIGTVDDRIGVAPRWRVLAELGLALLLTLTGTGWDFVSGTTEQFALNAIWIVGFVNAFNLMDNMDGAAGCVGAVSAAGIAAFAVVQDDMGIAAMMLAMSGACAGFLRYNLSRHRKARIFLGDGGSIPLGFTIAACATQINHSNQIGWPVLLTAGLLLAAPVLDTMLVIVSRSRRGIALTQGGQDHLTHRLERRLGSPLAVAATLVTLQAVVSAIALLAFDAGRGAVVTTAFLAVAGGLGLVALLDSAAWAPSPPLPRAHRAAARVANSAAASAHLAERS